VNKLVSVSYFTLGFVIGNLAGITEATITIPIISGLFAFIGGSAIAMLQKIKFRDRVTASLMVLTICLGLLSGLYLGLWTRGVFTAQTTKPTTHEVPKPKAEFIRKSHQEELTRDFIERYKKYGWDRDTMLKELENLKRVGSKLD